MEWLTEKKVVDKVRTDKYMIEETDIECRHEDICNSIMEENVDIHTINLTAPKMHGKPF